MGRCTGQYGEGRRDVLSENKYWQFVVYLTDCQYINSMKEPGVHVADRIDLWKGLQEEILRARIKGPVEIKWDYPDPVTIEVTLFKGRYRQYHRFDRFMIEWTHAPEQIAQQMAHDLATKFIDYIIENTGK